MRGTLVLDRICGPIGRLRIASGTHNKEEWRKLNDMLTDLCKEARWDVLKLLKPTPAIRGARPRAPTLTPLQLYWKRFRGEGLPNAKNLRPLSEALETWLAGVENAESTKETYRGIIARFTERHPDATLGQVAELLTGEKGDAQEADTKPSWNLLRSLLLSFLGDTLGKRHELYMTVQDVPPFQVKHREGNPQTVEQIRALVQKMSKDDGAIIWALCLTGMRKGEYWGAWELLPDRIIVRGTK